MKIFFNKAAKFNFMNKIMENNFEKKFVKITCISDTHNKTKDLILPEGDILIHCGDFTKCGRKKEIIQFNEFMKNQNFKHKIVIAGNHDVPFDSENYDYLIKRFKDLRIYKNERDIVTYQEAKDLLKDCIYLENSGINIENINIWGYPISDTGGVDGAFYYSSEKDSEILKTYLDKIPENIDILISHGPPKGILDKIVDGSNVGCELLREYVLNKIKPKYHLFGHIHESNGRTQIKIGDKEINFINAALCNVKYQPLNEIFSFEYEIKN